MCWVSCFDHFFSFLFLGQLVGLHVRCTWFVCPILIHVLGLMFFFSSFMVMGIGIGYSCRFVFSIAVLFLTMKQINLPNITL